MSAPSSPALADQAVAYVQAYCGWHVAPEEDETLTLDGPGGWALTLPSLRVSAIASVTENGTELVAEDDYTWSASGIIQRRAWAGDPEVWIAGRWTCNYRAVVVELTHGYEEWPVDLAGVISGITERLTSNPTGLEQITVGPFSERYASGGALPAAERSILDAYRLPKRV